MSSDYKLRKEFVEVLGTFSSLSAAKKKAIEVGDGNYSIAIVVGKICDETLFSVTDGAILGQKNKK